jgi:hypothetical protein
MAFFPILSAPSCSGRATLYNFAPNNWEQVRRVTRKVYVTWSDGEVWRSQCVGELGWGQSKCVSAVELDHIVSTGAFPLLSLTEAKIPARSMLLPLFDAPHTSCPAWRSTLELVSSQGGSSAYQGEIDPFPSPGSLLAFGHLLQVGFGINNTLLLLNIEKKPQFRTAQLELRDAAHPERLLDHFEVRSNTCNIVPLDWPGLTEEVLPLIICRQMSGIPLYCSSAMNGEYLSLEHSHPPASTVIFGRRAEAQRILKRIWFERSALK